MNDADDVVGIVAGLEEAADQLLEQEKHVEAARATANLLNEDPSLKKDGGFTAIMEHPGTKGEKEKEVVVKPKYELLFWPVAEELGLSILFLHCHSLCLCLSLATGILRFPTGLRNTASTSPSRT